MFDIGFDVCFKCSSCRRRHLLRHWFFGLLLVKICRRPTYCSLGNLMPTTKHTLMSRILHATDPTHARVVPRVYSQAVGTRHCVTYITVPWHSLFVSVSKARSILITNHPDISVLVPVKTQYKVRVSLEQCYRLSTGRMRWSRRHVLDANYSEMFGLTLTQTGLIFIIVLPYCALCP